MSNIKLFESRQIRSVWHEKEQKWYFVVADVVQVLTDTPNPSDYIKKMRKRDEELSKGWGQIVTPLEIITSGGPQKTNCSSVEGLFRIIQSIPSPKAEPFKRWLAKTGYERVQEIENPELAQKRMKATYRAKGYPEDWIERRVRGIAIRDELTDEWQKRGVTEQQDYAILTAEISKATFGITPSDYKKLKGLKRENLRDHMNDLELLFTQLGEAATTEIARTDNARGMSENKNAAKRGGAVAGTARQQLEQETGQKVVSKKNYLPKNHNKKISR